MKFRKPIIFFWLSENEFLLKEIKSILYTNQKIKSKPDNNNFVISEVAASNTTMLKQEFTKDGLPSLRPYLNYLIDNKAAEYKLINWGKGQRWAVIIHGKKYQYKGGHEFNKSLKNKIVSLYIGMSESSEQKTKKRYGETNHRRWFCWV